MREHITGAVQFVSNNRLKFDRPEQPISAPADAADTFGHVHKAVPQPPTKEVLEKLNTPEIKERCADLLSRYPEGQGALLEVLWLVQGVFGWVPREGIRWAAGVCGCAPAHALGVATFYTMYNHAPKGKFLLQFCRNISCTIKGAPSLISYVENALNIKTGETTPDGLFTILQVECLGSCGNGPMMLVNDDFATDVENDQLVMKPGTTLTQESITRILKWCYAHENNMPKHDVLGGVVKGHCGHPGAPGATAKPQVADYAPPSPVLNVKAEADEAGASLTWKGAPEFTKLVVEKKNGSKWEVVGEPGVKDKVFVDVAGKVGDVYRMIATSGERTAKPSKEAEATQKPAPVEEAK
ncbi:MAG: NAD(P)H-dependent oxidoreductase subunit E [Fibrobacter sp.]|jgi:NADH:ubiquinone oxidoreductase subunit E|uniref:NADH-quinone oxidoreductase subunit NuoE family protein n=1 Tax=Fibrobacter sp. UWP2 TaxID=1896216 RepID=UPI00091FABD4|nr:NAD(P)H-dependent oxidoreductase subunit E [Fibrobacter sp. UWP2]MBO7383519.1 NAD(P)H-dependent oxidoreductase subunit E [Fibrobacter sp.]SHJ23021.1 NADH:ubiquinone oxidoreductase subunit (chain E) [Fibrobacter sp. UWP2]